MGETSRRVLWYVLTGIVLSALFWLLRDSTWQGSKDLHTIMEVIATLLAFGVGTLGLIRYYSKPDNTILLIAAAFLGTFLLDGYHAVVTSRWFDVLWPSPPPHLIPWSWNASRTFLAMMMLLSWLAWRREVRLGPRGAISPTSVFVFVGVLTASSFLFFALTPLPRAYYPELAFGRPEEFVSAFLFLLALVGYLSKGRWKNDLLEHWVVLSLIVGVIGQAVFMSTSFHLYDTMFDMAHLLKKASYICVLTGLLISIFLVLKQAEADRTALDKLNAELVQDKAIAEEMARKDPLTGLGNRRTFFSAVSTIDQQAKQSGRTYSIVLIDLDYFKSINDTHGHPVGDEVLKWVARTIQEAVRRSDIPTRIGGEEFGVLMPGTHLGDAANLAERLRKAIADTVLPGHGKSIQVTASIGVTEYGENDETYKQTIQRADEALYLAKGEGRNRVVIKPLA